MLDKRYLALWVGWINEHAMPIYLFHSTGMAVVAAILFGFGYVPPAEPTLEWWLTRPNWLIGPAIAHVAPSSPLRPSRRRTGGTGSATPA